LQSFHEGGLAGGESKEDFWRVVYQCCQSLPQDKPRYCMGVGYALDLVICTALGVDMYDCVYPTRTARFGVALVDSGTLKLKSHECSKDDSVIDQECRCQACQHNITRSRLHMWLKSNNTLAVQLLTNHNLVYMMNLTRAMREAIVRDSYPDFCRSFLTKQFPRGDTPQWAKNALEAVGIRV
jgi:queuine tRNA-ribosyltransferase